MIKQISLTSILDLIQEFNPLITIEQKENFINQVQRTAIGRKPGYAWNIIHSLFLISHIRELNVPLEFKNFDVFLNTYNLFVLLDQDVDIKKFEAIEGLDKVD